MRLYIYFPIASDCFPLRLHVVSSQSEANAEHNLGLNAFFYIDTIKHSAAFKTKVLRFERIVLHEGIERLK